MKITGILTVVLIASACTRQETKTAGSEAPSATPTPTQMPTVDLSGVYRADKALQAALSTNRFSPDLPKLAATLKTEISIVQDHVSFDPRLRSLKLFVERYNRILHSYEVYEAILSLIDDDISCMKRATETGSDAESMKDGLSVCRSRATGNKPQVNALRKELQSLGINCDPYAGGGFSAGSKCDFVAQIAPIEADATASYMQLTSGQQPRP
jgi:hypothetical protein